MTASIASRPLADAYRIPLHLCLHSDELEQRKRANEMVMNEDTYTTAGVLKAIAWLRKAGRPILADKMERELLLVNRKRHPHPVFSISQCGFGMTFTAH
jgi:hypothetical protein